MKRRRDQSKSVSRRDLLVAGVGVGAGVATAALTVNLGAPGPSVPAAAPEAALEPGAGPVPSRGAHQAGLDRPATPQAHALIIVADSDALSDQPSLLAWLASVGEVVDTCTDIDRASPDILPDGPGDLAVTIGIGPRLVALVDNDLPDAGPLPPFAGDSAMHDSVVGGDVLIAVYSSDVSVLKAVGDVVLQSLSRAHVRWSQAGARGPGSGTIVRNPLGYHDGIVVPRTDDEMVDNVWIRSGAAAGGSIAVVRRLRLAIDEFRALDGAAQDQVIGRTRVSGAPLTGGNLESEADLLKKSPEGEYLTPLRSHVRAAHPTFTASKLMLRRGYGYSNAVAADLPADNGLLFICFQDDIGTFVKTQLRMDETDDLLSYVTPTASASFLIPAGYDGATPFGSRLAQRV
ncbi:Dyp-type peroxidase [Microbacterium sp. NPDC076911]|uniref:Dyp-type peroxidase n=1 Tax=Microbacterium sp. NPDC076911 TaxID=3154958 RepID=UPI0034493AD4